MLGSDQSYKSASRIYRKQQPIGQTFNNNAVVTEQVFDAGSLLQLNGVVAQNGTPVPAGVSFAIVPFGAAGSNETKITIQVVDGGGQPIAGLAYNLDVIVSDAASGAGLTAKAITTAVTDGTTLSTYSANKGFYVQTDGNGQIVITIVDATKDGLYVAVQGAGLLPAVSRQLVTGDYS